jgi:hypothetical protein
VLAVSQRHSVPLTVAQVVEGTQHGSALLKSTHETRCLAEVARMGLAQTGSACKREMVGLAAGPNKCGQLSTAIVAGLAGVKPSTVRGARMCVCVCFLLKSCAALSWAAPIA